MRFHFVRQASLGIRKLCCNTGTLLDTSPDPLCLPQYAKLDGLQLRRVGDGVCDWVACVGAGHVVSSCSTPHRAFRCLLRGDLRVEEVRHHNRNSETVRVDGNKFEDSADRVT